MINSKIFKITGIASLAICMAMASCGKKRASNTTGQAYNNPKWGGFANPRYKGQETGPGLVLIEGGSFSMGSTEQDLEFNNDNVERRVTVNSFYMDETEVSNIQYLEYAIYPICRHLQVLP